jgi:hypothetical protein
VGETFELPELLVKRDELVQHSRLRQHVARGGGHLIGRVQPTLPCRGEQHVVGHRVVQEIREAGGHLVVVEVIAEVVAGAGAAGAGARHASRAPHTHADVEKLRRLQQSFEAAAHAGAEPVGSRGSRRSLEQRPEGRQIRLAQRATEDPQPEGTQELIPAGGLGRGAGHEASVDRGIAHGSLRHGLGGRSVLRPEALVDTKGVARLEAEAVEGIGRKGQVDRLAKAEEILHGVLVLRVAQPRDPRVGSERSERWLGEGRARAACRQRIPSSVHAGSG